MDSDSPERMRIAGQPICDLGTPFTAGNMRKRFTGTRWTRFGPDAAPERGYRGLPDSHRRPDGYGYRP